MSYRDFARNSRYNDGTTWFRADHALISTMRSSLNRNDIELYFDFVFDLNFTSATFAASSRLRAVIYFCLRRSLPELPFRRGLWRCSEQDQQGSHRLVGHLLISRARNAGASQLHPPRGR